MREGGLSGSGEREAPRGKPVASLRRQGFQRQIYRQQKIIYCERSVERGRLVGAVRLLGLGGSVVDGAFWGISAMKRFATTSITVLSLPPQGRELMGLITLIPISLIGTKASP
jgi:hypothetical protein